MIVPTQPPNIHYVHHHHLHHDQPLHWNSLLQGEQLGEPAADRRRQGVRFPPEHMADVA